MASGDLAEEAARLKAQPGGFILPHGGAHFARSLAAAGPVDEYQLLVNPVALGQGLPLFGGLLRPLSPRLVWRVGWVGDGAGGNGRLKGAAR